jgi:hypothetical protein
MKKEGVDRKVTESIPKSPPCHFSCVYAGSLEGWWAPLARSYSFTGPDFHFCKMKKLCTLYPVFNTEKWLI